MENPLENLIPEDMFDDSSTPQNEYDDWFHTTHRNTKPVYEEPDDSDECIEDCFDDLDEM